MTVSFIYRNHRNEVKERVVQPLALHYNPMPRNDFNHQPGWFLHCLDYTGDRQGEPRSFELNSIMMPENDFVAYHIPAFVIPLSSSEYTKRVEGHRQELWDLLGVDDQKAALERIEGLLNK